MKANPKLSQTSKMPGKSWSLPAWSTCPGARDAKNEPVEACSRCYALTGAYVWPKAKALREHNLADWKAANWVEAMTAKLYGVEYFRWFDSGDIYTRELARKIHRVMAATPSTKHWLPTREYKIVRDFLHWGSFPDNLTVRLSAHKIDEKAPKVIECQTSTVNKNKPALGVNCKAYRTNKDKKVLSDETFQALTKQEKKDQGLGICGDCRLCWDKSIDNISYKYH